MRPTNEVLTKPASRSKRRTGSEQGWRVAAVAGVLGILLMLVLQFWPADATRVRAEPATNTRTEWT
ncbi:MAG: hypothetical protein ACREJB_10885, partial [Planctomycetaceae bacterium]